jgi:hypothetical protein
MAYAKAVVDFSREADGDLQAPSKKIHDDMDANAATFPSLPLTLAAFLTFIGNYVTALGNALKGGSDRINLKNDARTALENALYELGTYVNLVAKGDQTIVDQSGFPSYTTDRVQSTGGVTFIPQNVRWEDGTVGGEEILRWKGDGTKSMYEAQTCTGDPNNPANWNYRGSFSGGKAVLKGFTAGTVIWGRVRKIGKGGEVGDWSDPAQIMAT